MASSSGTADHGLPGTTSSADTFSPATILIVDDVASHRAYLVKLLQEPGHLLLEAPNGKVALEIIGSQHIDLVITDVLMPVMDGFELVRQLRRNPATGAIPVLFYTAPYGERDARELARSSGGAHVLRKPAEAPDVLRIVHMLLAGGTVNEADAPESLISDSDLLRLRTEQTTQEIGDLRLGNTQLRALINIGLELMSTPDSDAMLRSVCLAACDLFGASYATLGIRDQAVLTVRRVVASGVEIDSWIKAGDTLGGTLKSIAVDRRTLRGVSGRGEPNGLELPTGHPPVQAFLAAPIASPAQVHGWLFLAGNEGTEFSADDEELIQALAGQVGRIYELEHEVLERRNAESALRKSKDLNRTLVEHLPHRILIKDRDSRILFCNDNYARDLGLATDQVLGKVAAEFFPGDIAAASDADDQEVISAGMVRVVEASHLHDGQERWVHTVKMPYRDENNEVIGILVVFEDITNRKKLESQFLQSQKLEGIGQLAGGVAHDFNNLLTVILAHCELLASDPTLDAGHADDILQIQRAGMSAAGLTRQLLAFSRKQVVELTVLDLGEIVGEMRGMLSRLIGEDIKILLGLSADQVFVRADRGQIEQVLMNLALNARDAMRAGGTLTIEAGRVDLDADYPASHLTGVPGPYVVLTVTDTGTGMSAEVQQRLFEPFFTTKEPGRGTGLGLATVHGIVTQAGGSINVYSELGRGTSFKVYFPRVEPEARSKIPAVSITLPARGTGTILVVEDEAALRNITRRLLQRQGYTVLAASNADEARALFAQNPGVELLLTDVVMPGDSGPELAASLVGKVPGLKIVYMSGYPKAALSRRDGLPPEFTYLHKPFTSESLIRKLGEALASGE